ncbi:MAG: hypothetical protein IVW52_12550 [Acidimicrobiales bacterium]|nr:hypothetical protein [Acidimicrobiales bacterium]
MNPKRPNNESRRTRERRQAEEAAALRMELSTRGVNLRGWPGGKPMAIKRPPTYSPRLAERVSLVMVAAAELGAMRETFGLGAYLVIAGPSTLDAGIIVSDTLDAEALKGIETWARNHRVITAAGSRRWAVVTVSQFFDPRRGTFVQRTYSGSGWFIGADLGRVFGLTAEHVVPRRGRNAGSWEIYPPGWGYIGPKQNVRKASPHRPPLRISSGRTGWQVEFGPVEHGNGKQRNGQYSRGDFLDVLSLADSQDGDRAADFSQHRVNFGLAPHSMPIAVPVTGEGAQQMADAVAAVHELALVLDEKAADWFTTAQDRAEGRGRIDLCRTPTPGTLAAQIPARFGVRAPMATFDLTEEEHLRWAESFHGGWTDACPKLLGTPFPAVTLDVSSCFPLVAHLIGWWEVLCADGIGRQNRTDALRRLCERSIADPAVVLDPAVWKQFGCCLVTVQPDGEPFPVEVEDKHRPDGRLEVVPLYSPDRPMHYSALDVLAAAVLSGQVPEILSATAYRPIGHQTSLRLRLPMLPGLTLTPEDDPAVELVARRRNAKAAGDIVLGAELRVVVNALTYGNLCRFDRELSKVGQTWVRRERPGPLNCMPIASSVTAGSHLLLAVLDRIVRDKGGLVAYRASDSSIVPSSPLGGEQPLTGGGVIHALSWSEVDSIVAPFDALSPDPEWTVWKVDRGTETEPMQAVIFGPNRHAEVVGDEVVDLTEAQLGGVYSDPPSMRGRDGKIRAWSLPAVAREVAYAVDRNQDPDKAVRPDALWDAGSVLAFPALRRLSARTPEMVRLLPSALGPRPGTRYAEASEDEWSLSSCGRIVVAFDPGGALDDWSSLGWVDKHTGEPVRVTTDTLNRNAVAVESLDRRAIQWSRRPLGEPIESVTVNADLLSHRGLVSGVLDANGDGIGGSDLWNRRVVYDESNAAAFVVAEADRLGPSAFAGRYGVPISTAEKLSAGRAPGRGTVHKVLAAVGPDGNRACALDGCTEPVSRTNAIFCCKAHRDRAFRQRRQAERERLLSAPKRPRKAASDPFAGLPRCVRCEAVMAGTADRGDGVCFSCDEEGVA